MVKVTAVESIPSHFNVPSSRNVSVLQQHSVSSLLQFSTTIFLPETDFVLFLAVLENSLLPNGLRQLTRDVKSDVRTINFISDVIFVPPRKTPNDVRKMSLCDVKCQK